MENFVRAQSGLHAFRCHYLGKGGTFPRFDSPACLYLKQLEIFRIWRAKNEKRPLQKNNQIA